MSTSEARILANRANALKSTGPKTETGKLQSRRNSLQHGLAGAGTVLLPADEAKLIERRESWGEVLRPKDEVEVYLVERAVVHSVKLDRLSTVESSLACTLVERADRDYEANALAKIESVETEVRQWERLEGEMNLRGTLVRDGLKVIYRLLGIEGREDPRASDLVALTRAASAEMGRDEASRAQARVTLGDLLGARLDERRRALTRLFEELENPRGRALARASAALDVGTIGQLVHRYEKAEELGLTRMLDQLDRRRKVKSKVDASKPDPHPSQSPKSVDCPSQTAQSPKIGGQIDDVGDLGKLPNEANDPTTEAQPEDSGDLGKLPNEPNDLGIAARSDGSGNLGKLPNEANDLGIAARSDGSGDLGKLPNEANDLGAAGRSDGSGDLGKLPNEANDLGTQAQSDGSGDLGKLPNEANDLGAATESNGSGDLGKVLNEANEAGRPLDFRGL